MTGDEGREDVVPPQNEEPNHAPWGPLISLRDIFHFHVYPKQQYDGT